VQMIDSRLDEGQAVEVVTEVSDYRPVGGLMFPHRIEVGPKGKPERQRLLIQHVEINPPLDAAHFTMPAGSPAKPQSSAAKPQASAVLP
jgi:hypothetical protein